MQENIHTFKGKTVEKHTMQPISVHFIYQVYTAKLETNVNQKTPVAHFLRILNFLDIQEGIIAAKIK
jgi:hypothetical protein